jgi:hypothetical protein
MHFEKPVLDIFRLYLKRRAFLMGPSARHVIHSRPKQYALPSVHDPETIAQRWFAGTELPLR